MARGIARTSVTFISEIAQPELVPARAHAGLVLGRRAHGRREALVPPLGAARESPRARGVEEHAIPQPGAQAAHLAVLERRRRIDRRAEDAGEDHQALLA